jgi:hypothetical protein
VTHRAFCGALVEESGRLLSVPVPPSPRLPDLEAVENVDKDKEKRDDEDNENSAVAETEHPPRVEAVATEKPHGVTSPPPLLQELQRNLSPPPLAQEQQRLRSRPPLAQDPQPHGSGPPLPEKPHPLCSRPPFLKEHQPVVALLPSVDGMLILNLVFVLVLIAHRCTR